MMGSMVILGLLYYIPAIVAYAREHPKTAAITLLNTFLGWTLVGWVISLAWSVSRIQRPEGK